MALAPASYLTLEEAKSHIGGNANSTAKDALIERIVDGACAAVERYIQRTVKKASYIELYDGDGSDFLYLDNPPAVVANVWVDTERQFGDETKLRSEGTVDDEYIVSREADAIELLGCKFPKGKQCVKVEYEGGWADADIPKDLKYATLLVVAHWYGLDGGGRSMMGKNQAGLTGAGYVGNNVTVNQATIPPQAKKILNQFITDTGLGW